MHVKIRMCHAVCVAFLAVACQPAEVVDATSGGQARGATDDDKSDKGTSSKTETFEFVVVGSGAGGGPLAANLARAGFKVLLLEAGEDTGKRLTYQIPAWHPLSTEDEAMRWDFFVNHYEDPARQLRDSKLVWDGAPGAGVPKGVLYPRAGTLGGCTAHNAMIFVAPHESDWHGIADLTGDESWRPDLMRTYFQRVEQNRYLDTVAGLQGHGTDGWLAVERADPRIAVTDTKLQRILLAAADAFVGNGGNILLSLVKKTKELIGILKRDLNAAGPERDAAEGLYQIPQSTIAGRRNGTREYLLRTVEEGHPLTIRTKSLVTNLVWAKSGNQVAGVEYFDGAHLYRADPRAPASGKAPKKKKVLASREVILSAGTYNTPQLLMLSGIGPKAELAKHGIKVKVDLPGVGTNLQDRYEVGVVSEVDGEFASVKDCDFTGKDDDPCFLDWQYEEGPYTSNGGVAAIVKRSAMAELDPDLFIFGVPGFFKGYYPGYSQDSIADRRHFSWVVLKAHTANRAGRVTLRSKDPRDTPRIDFRYFEEGDTALNEDARDLAAVVEGVKLARKIISKADALMPFGYMDEVWPGPGVQSDEQIGQFVKDEAWGHHACCTAPIGADGDPSAVLDSRFRVRGVKGLRVVDASVFPRIPGFFIVVPIFMVSEKAADVILQDYGVH